MRSAMAARFLTLRERVERTLPPLTCFSGHRPSQEAKAEALRKRETSGPTSIMMVCAVMALMPGTSVRSTPAIRNSSPLQIERRFVAGPLIKATFWFAVVSAQVLRSARGSSRILSCSSTSTSAMSF